MPYEALSVYNIQRIVDEVQDVRQTARPLRWESRIPSVPAVDGEILGRYRGRIYAADIIAMDQAAAVRAPQPISLTRTEIPKLKHGEHLTEHYLDLLNRIRSGGAIQRDRNIFEDYIARRVVQLVDGVRQRMEVLRVAMLLDTFTYDRLGIKLSGLGWGMPSDLKVTASPVWSGSTGKPFTDIMGLVSLAAEKYGVILDRVTMSTAALVNMSKTTEFQQMALPFLSALSLAQANLPEGDRRTMLNLASQRTGLMFEVDDSQYWTEGVSGAETATRYFPVEKVILSSSQFDGDADVWDWANGVVYETMPGTVPTAIGEFGGLREGPVGYATAGDPQGNPPGVILWGVGRGFPRKHMIAANAVITAY